jgi:hypothetical protein
MMTPKLQTSAAKQPQDDKKPTSKGEEYSRTAQQTNRDIGASG